MTSSVPGAAEGGSHPTAPCRTNGSTTVHSSPSHRRAPSLWNAALELFCTVQPENSLFSFQSSFSLSPFSFLSFLLPFVSLSLAFSLSLACSLKDVTLTPADSCFLPLLSASHCCRLQMREVPGSVTNLLGWEVLSSSTCAGENSFVSVCDSLLLMIKGVHTQSFCSTF